MNSSTMFRCLVAVRGLIILEVESQRGSGGWFQILGVWDRLTGPGYFSWLCGNRWYS